MTTELAFAMRGLARSPLAAFACVSNEIGDAFEGVEGAMWRVFENKVSYGKLSFLAIWR